MPWISLRSRPARLRRAARARASCRPSRSRVAASDRADRVAVLGELLAHARADRALLVARHRVRAHQLGVQARGAERQRRLEAHVAVVAGDQLEAAAAEIEAEREPRADLQLAAERGEGEPRLFGAREDAAPGRRSPRRSAAATVGAVARVAQRRGRDGDQQVDVVRVARALAEQPRGLDGALADVVGHATAVGDRRAEAQHHALAQHAAHVAVGASRRRPAGGTTCCRDRGRRSGSSASRRRRRAPRSGSAARSAASRARAAAFERPHGALLAARLVFDRETLAAQPFEHGADRVAVRAERPSRDRGTWRRTRRALASSPPSASRSSISIGRPVACASGASVWRQRSAGLDTIRSTPLPRARAASERACARPASTSGRTSGGPLHCVRFAARACRTRCSFMRPAERRSDGIGSEARRRTGREGAVRPSSAREVGPRVLSRLRVPQGLEPDYVPRHGTSR